MRNANMAIQEARLRENIAKVIAYSIKTFGFWVDFADKDKIMKVLGAGNIRRNVHFYDSLDVMSSYIDVLHDFVPHWENVKVYSDKGVTGTNCNIIYALNKKYALNWVLSNYNIPAHRFSSHEDLSKAVFRIDPSLSTRDFGD